MTSCMSVVCRWVKFEEVVEEGGDRWSKPHVATLSLHSLFELRKGMLSGTVMLDLEAWDIQGVTGESHAVRHRDAGPRGLGHLRRHR